MNIKDVKEVPYSINNPEDMLTAIFNRQKELMEKYHKIEQDNGCLLTSDIPVNMNDRLGQMRLKDFAWRITEEIGEAMNCLKNKPWKSSMMETDIAHYHEELADALHFFVELFILSGLGPEDVYRLYFKKSEVNKFRQRTNY